MVAILKETKDLILTCSLCGRKIRGCLLNYLSIWGKPGLMMPLHRKCALKIKKLIEDPELLKEIK